MKLTACCIDYTQGAIYFGWMKTTGNINLEQTFSWRNGDVVHYEFQNITSDLTKMKYIYI